MCKVAGERCSIVKLKIAKAIFSFTNFIKEQSSDTLKLTYDKIENIAGIPLDHLCLTYKKELLEFGWQVKKIHMKEKCVEFEKTK